MNRVEYKRSIYCLLCIITLILVGCEKESVEMVENISLSICADNTGKVYISDYQDTHITPDYRPLSTSFLLTGEKLYFIDTTDPSIQSICEVSLQNSDTPTKLPINLGEASIKALAADRTNAENPTIYCMAMNLPGNGFLAAFSQEGEELWRTEFGDSLNQSMQENEVFRLIQDGEGRFYALSMQWIFLFDSTGAYQGEIECPEKSFLGISPCGEEKVYASYQGDAGQQPFLAEVQFQSKKLTEGKRVLGNGSLYEGAGNSLILCDSSAVYSCEPDSERVIKLFDFKDYNIINGEIQAITQVDTDEIKMVSWELLNQNSSVELIGLKEAQEGEAEGDGKQVITLLGINVSFMESLFGEVIADFNKQSKDYKVVFEGIGVNGDIYSSINTRLMAKESADLLYIFDYEDIERYQSKGYLEDLTPYLEQSELIKREDYIEEVLNCFEIDGKLYGMSSGFGIDTLMGRVSELGGTSGWTQEEFLDWMKQHPKTKSQFGLNKETVLEYCLKGNLDSYMDWETGKAFFEGEYFKELLSTIYGLDTDDNTYYDDWYQILGQEGTILEMVSVGYFERNNIYTELQYGDEVVFIGYPSADGTPRHFLSMACLSILNRSVCKEGAYAFLEYYITHQKCLDSTYYTKKADFEEGLQKTLEREITIVNESGEQENVPALTETQLERQMELLKYAVPDSLSAQTVRQLILEEAQAYFRGDKALDDTCRIIQSRVQLYLDENQ